MPCDVDTIAVIWACHVVTLQASPAWSVYHDIGIGSTCHRCTAGIDTGDILLRREVPVKKGYTCAPPQHSRPPTRAAGSECSPADPALAQSRAGVASPCWSPV